MLNADEWAVPLRAVGWLEHPREFTVGQVPPEFLIRLATLVKQMRASFPHYAFRGVHECTHCIANGTPTPRQPGWSQENVLVPGLGEVYAAPGGILHYVENHGYAPPQAFIEAVLRCPDCHSADYLDALCLANGGFIVPMESNAQFSARIREELLKAAVIGRERKTAGNPTRPAERLPQVSPHEAAVLDQRLAVHQAAPETALAPEEFKRRRGGGQ